MLVLGHRGAASADAPENTLAAVDRALRLGADGVEVDLRLTADGVPVCQHDPLGRVRLAELPVSVPTLAEVLDLVGDRGRLVLELKGFGLLRRSSGLVDAVVGELRRLEAAGAEAVISDRPRAARAALRLAAPSRPAAR